jgi:23S rRNA pseudouridine2605 synthase
MSDKKQNRNAPPPGGDRPSRRPAAKSGAPGKAQGKPAGKPAGKTFGKSSDKPQGKAFARTGGGKPGYGKPARETSGGERAAGQKPFAGRSDAPRGKPAFERPARAPAAERAQDQAFAGDRIAKVMARAGVCSRRDAEIWITEGRVAVNGRVLASPAVNVADSDRIEIDGKPMQARERTRLFLFHKPIGLVTSARDPEGRETVFDYLDNRHSELPRLISVGRLDINTEGLLLLTNDGGLARTLELPATGWTRRYRVRAHGAIDQARLDTLKRGVVVEGVVYAPIDALLERVQGANAWIAMTLTEGKNREIKRVLAHLGLEVTRLIRVSYGPFQLGDLPEGAVEEVKLKVLREQLGKNLAELAGVDFSAPARELTAAEREEMRQRADKRPRKHVSVLRQQRAEQAASGPRARIERSATADRKGRAVAVERVTPTRTRATEDAPTTRNARRFEAMRDGERPLRRERAAASADRRDDAPPRARHERNWQENNWRERGREERGGQERRRQEGGRQERNSQERGREERGRPARDSRGPDRRFDRSFDGRADRQEGRPEGRRDDRRAGDAARSPRRNAEGFQPREPRRDDAGAHWQKPRGAPDRNRGAGTRGDFGDQKRERSATGPGRSGEKPGGKFGGKSGGKSGGKFSGKPGYKSDDKPRSRPDARSGPRSGPRSGGPGKGPRSAGPRKPRGA